ncbi:Ig-like domain-containing protein [Terriglobus albidus]|uniref:Ig-like domain-containing protein n=1 Tax=Terriglobus albidus TaxID=1592106 RepID=UPI0021E08FD6|nr:Ig-like domain-containing protein [Terriglobus albidus]
MNVFVRLMLFFGCAIPALATVAVTSPTNNTTVGPSVRVTASATTSCSKGVASMGIYVDHALQRVVDGTNLDSSISLSPGKHRVVVQEWDYCGGATYTSLDLTSSSSSGVNVASPANGSKVGTPAIYVASATTACDKGVSAMGIYVNHQLVYKVAGSTLATPITMGHGRQSTVVQAWDNCGGTATTPIDVTVTGTRLTNLQAAPGWNQWGQLPPVYDICDAPCPGVNWSMIQNQKTPSLSGNATQFYLGGTTPYSDVLFSNPVIGHGNKQGLTDESHTLLPTLHDFLYDTDVYVSNWAVTQVLEFDLNMYAGGVGMEWGTECNHLNGNVWDYWNNVEARWVPTSIPCTLKDGWNHVTLQAHRQANNDLLYQSITVNGVVYPLNITVAPKSVPSGWWGMTVNYQMDGNYKMDGYTTALDNFHFTYW